MAERTRRTSGNDVTHPYFILPVAGKRTIRTARQENIESAHKETLP